MKNIKSNILEYIAKPVMPTMFLLVGLTLLSGQDPTLLLVFITYVCSIMGNVANKFLIDRIINKN